MDIKKLIKKIIAIAGSLVLVVAIIVGDVVCYAHENEITSHLCPDKIVANSEQSTEALAESDKVIQRVAEEGITLLKNNGTLPLAYENNLDEEDKFATLTLGSQDGAKRVYRRSDTLRPDFQRKNIGHFLHRMCVNMVFASGKLR